MSRSENISHKPPSLDEVRAEPFYEKDLAQMARALNYLKWQFDLIAPYVQGNTLEIGGGIGNFTTRLAKRATQVVSVEPNAYCYKRLNESVAGQTNIRVFDCVAEELETRLGPDSRFDTVVCMNVLEHIADDLKATATFARYLKPGGRLILQIPALGFLFGEIDRKLGHYRRYSKQSARTLLYACELRPVRLRYFNFVGVWAWLWNAHATKATTQSDFQIKVFDRGIVPWLSVLERVVPPPMGQCLLAIAEKTSAS